MTDIDWRAQAKCRDHDPELWFPKSSKNGGDRRTLSLSALDICRTCPVRQQCLDWAIATGEKWAIAGGHDFATQSNPETMKGGAA